MKLRRSRAAKRGRIEIIPMIDVMFFLLATFILASLAMQRVSGIKVNLPQGEAAAVTTDHQPTITVSRDNRVYVNGKEVALAQLPAELSPLLGGGEPVVIISADRAALEGTVAEAMLSARKAGAVHFSIVVRHE